MLGSPEDAPNPTILDRSHLPEASGLRSPLLERIISRISTGCVWPWTFRRRFVSCRRADTKRLCPERTRKSSGRTTLSPAPRAAKLPIGHRLRRDGPRPGAPVARQAPSGQGTTTLTAAANCAAGPRAGGRNEAPPGCSRSSRKSRFFDEERRKRAPRPVGPPPCADSVAGPAARMRALSGCPRWPNAALVPAKPAVYT